MGWALHAVYSNEKDGMRKRHPLLFSRQNLELPEKILMLPFRLAALHYHTEEVRWTLHKYVDLPSPTMS